MVAIEQSTADTILEDKIVNLAGELLAGKLANTFAAVGEVVAALSKAQAAFTNVTKSKTADAGKYTYQYADLADVMEMVRKPLSENGLAISHTTSFRAADGWNCMTRLYHTSGQYLETVLPIHAGTPQAMGSELTYMRRYGLSCLLGIVTDVDDDGGVAEEATRQKRPQAASSKASAPKTKTTRVSDRASSRKPAKPKDPDSKAGDGTPPRAKLTSFWPMVYETGEALGLDKDGTVAWIRKELKQKQFPASSKDLEQSQINAVMLWLHEVQQDPEGDHQLATWGAEPPQQSLRGEEPPALQDEDAPPQTG